MGTQKAPSDTLLALLVPARVGIAAVVCTSALFATCIVHALASETRLDDATALSRRLHLSELCLYPAEDLRHPGWARVEQAHAGQPSLPDPRGPTSIVRVVPMKVQR